MNMGVVRLITTILVARLMFDVDDSSSNSSRGNAKPPITIQWHKRSDGEILRSSLQHNGARELKNDKQIKSILEHK